LVPAFPPAVFATAPAALLLPAVPGIAIAIAIAVAPAAAGRPASVPACVDGSVPLPLSAAKPALGDDTASFVMLVVTGGASAWV
jgi:hypothetical protein